MHEENQHHKGATLPLLELFDYESVIANPQLTELRANNLMRFCKHIVEDILLKNLDPKLRMKKMTECDFLFSNELLLMTIKSRVNLLEKFHQMYKVAPNFKKMPPSAIDTYERKKREGPDKID